MKTTIFVDILLLLGVVCLFAMCTNGNRRTYNNNDDVTHASYNINHYLDTIYEHVIVTTVCEANNGQVSVATLELK